MQKIQEQIKKKFSDAISAIHDFRGDETAIVKKEALLDVMRFLKEDPTLDFNVLMDLTAVDYIACPSPYPSPRGGEGSEAVPAGGGGEGEKNSPRFEVVYHLYSLRHNHRVRIKVLVEEKDPVVPSLAGLWAAADWYEREVWDMFGIRFEGHPNLKRILMYEEFVGHPLRKDYPVNKRQPLIGPKN